MTLKLLAGTLLSVLVCAGSLSAQTYNPLDPFSKFTCVSFPNGKNKVAIIGKSSNRLTTFTKVSKSISTELKAIRDRIRTLNQLKAHAQEIESKEGLEKTLNRLSKKVLQETNFNSAAEISDALTRMETILSGQALLRQQELSALQNCKQNKKPLNLDATLKVGVVGSTSPTVVALAVVTASSVDGRFYCASIPTDNFGTIGTRKIKDEFESSPCTFDNCSSLVGAGNVGIVLFRAEFVSDPGQARLEAQIAALQAFYPALIHFDVLPQGLTECP